MKLKILMFLFSIVIFYGCTRQGEVVAIDPIFDEIVIKCDNNQYQQIHFNSTILKKTIYMGENIKVFTLDGMFLFVESYEIVNPKDKNKKVDLNTVMNKTIHSKGFENNGGKR